MPVVILSAKRTPIGCLGGIFRSLTCVDLAQGVIREAVASLGLEPNAIQEVAMGCAFQAGCGPNPALQAAGKAGLSPETTAQTINQSSGSGLGAVLAMSRALMAGEADFALAGGMESASSVPYLLPSARWGARMGATELRDGLIQDGPRPYPENGTAEITETGSTPEMDTDTRLDRSKAMAAQASGCFEREIVPVTVPSRGGLMRVSVDECFKPLLNRSAARCGSKPGVSQSGRALGDGAAALVLAMETTCGNTRPLARILDSVQTADTNGAKAIRKLLARTGFSIADIHRFEWNNTRADRVLRGLLELPELDPGKVNTWGGSGILGDPMGASGARILVTLLHTLQRDRLRYGIATLDADGGQSSAVLLECLT